MSQFSGIRSQIQYLYWLLASCNIIFEYLNPQDVRLPGLKLSSLSQRKHAVLGVWACPCGSCMSVNLVAADNMPCFFDGPSHQAAKGRCLLLHL